MPKKSSTPPVSKPPNSLEAKDLGDAIALCNLWKRRAQWLDDLETVRTFLQRALSQGEFLMAYDAARAAIEECHLSDVWVRQRMALALAQMGATSRAQVILSSLVASNSKDCETLSLLGRTYKDQWCADPSKSGYLRQAFECYSQAFKIEPPDYYPGINAAATALLLNETEEAKRIAREVLQICEAQPDGYWRNATIAEALIVLGAPEEAKQAYRNAVAAGGTNLRDLSSTRKQARILSRRLFARADIFDECFPIPKLVVFSGHMCDTPDRRVPRFPAEKEDTIRKSLEAQLAAMKAGIGFASAACGSDILFLEAMLDRGGIVHVVLPWPKEEFLKTSVDLGGEKAWRERFDSVLARSASVRILGELYMPATGIGFEYCTLTLTGLARLFARSLDLDLTPLAVWDGLPGAPGGTGSFVRYWRSHQIPIKIIPVGLPSASTLPQPEEFDSGAEPVDDEFEAWVRASGRQEIKAIMFADVVGYSKLPESAIPKFVAQFNQRVSRLIAASSSAPINVNTWGDGFYFVFSGVEDAGRFALDLRDLVVTTSWGDLGLPKDLSIRIAVHAGPVYVNFDPVVRQLTFTGAHVSRAARLEPITHEGEVFASEEFAALAAAENVVGFTCDFIGTMALAKSYGMFRIYSVERRVA